MSRVIFHPFHEVERDEKRELRKRAQRALVLRQLRSEFFGPGIAREVAWEMLLALFSHGRRLNIAQLTKITASPPTTALRWIDALEEQQLVFRQSSPTDQRVALISLTDRGEELMEKYLLAALTA